MTLRKILMELQGIRKELQAIQKSMESYRSNIANNFDSDLAKKTALNTLKNPIRLSQDSLARQIPLEQNDE